jgi:hypothetical protein
MDVAKVAKDAGYVALGLAIIRFQKAQVRRRELESQLSATVEQVTSLLPEPIKGLVERAR